MWVRQRYPMVYHLADRNRAGERSYDGSLHRHHWRSTPPSHSRRGDQGFPAGDGGPESPWEVVRDGPSVPLGEEKPPLEFLEAAADYLGVTPAWLICGEGSPKKLDVSSDAAYKLLWMVHDKEAVLGAFHAALRRLVQSAETDPEPEQVKRLGDLLVDLVREPYRRLGHGLPGGAPQLQDHYIALLSAITLIMPMWRSVPIESLSPD